MILLVKGEAAFFMSYFQAIDNDLTVCRKTSNLNNYSTGNYQIAFIKIVFVIILKPLLAPPQTVLLKHPTLLPGERILLQQDATCVDTFTSLVKGILHLTTYRVIFNGAIVQVIKSTKTRYK